MMRRLLATLCVTALAFVLVARADEPVKLKPGEKPKVENKDKDEQNPKAILQEYEFQQVMAKQQFETFSNALYNLASHLEKSAKPEDKDKAKILREAIKKAAEEGTENKFAKLINSVKDSKAVTLDGLESVKTQNEDLVRDIRVILAILLTDNRDAELRRQKEMLAKMIEELKRVIREQETVRARTDRNKTEAGPLKKSQENVTKATGDLIGAKKDAGEGKGAKGDPKGEGKPGESKADGKADSKGDGKSKGEGKGDGKPSDGKPADSKSGGQSGGNQAGGSKSDGGGSSSGSPKKEDKPPLDLPGKKQIEDAQNDQRKAEEDIEKGKNPDASKGQGDAIEKLKEVQKKWEELLRQLREEEIERVLAALQARCERMLAMQIVVRDGTVVVDKTVQDLPNKQPTRVEAQKANELSDQEEAIAREDQIAIDILAAEGTAVAFPEVFRELKDDMQNVAYRLRRTDVGTVTVVVENDIIQTLRELIEALKRARQENGKSPPSEGQPGKSDPSLINKLAELKALRDMQKRLNARTQTYAHEYPGEQAPAVEAITEPQEREKAEMLQREHKNLADRQQKILEVTTNIYKEKNK
ncbi:MAG TPA: hypothetical protein VGG61_15205 [Gemmataceae bacterium]|jgi:hypothetical protein